MDDNLTQTARPEILDEGQLRMLRAAEALFEVKEVRDRLHEFDHDKQPELLRM